MIGAVFGVCLADPTKVAITLGLSVVLWKVIKVDSKLVGLSKSEEASNHFFGPEVRRCVIHPKVQFFDFEESEHRMG